MAHDNKHFVPEPQVRRVLSHVVAQVIEARSRGEFPECVSAAAVAVDPGPSDWARRAAAADPDGNARALAVTGQLARSRKANAKTGARPNAFKPTGLGSAHGWARLVEPMQPKRPRLTPPEARDPDATRGEADVLFELGLLAWDLVSSGTTTRCPGAAQFRPVTASLPAYAPALADDEDGTGLAGADPDQGEGTPPAGEAGAAASSEPPSQAPTPEVSPPRPASGGSRLGTNPPVAVRVPSGSGGFAQAAGGGSGSAPTSTTSSRAVGWGGREAFPPGAGLSDLLTRLMDPRPSARCRMGLLGLLRHPWMRPAAAILGFASQAEMVDAAAERLGGPEASPTSQVAASPAESAASEPAAGSASSSSASSSSSSAVVSVQSAAHSAPWCPALAAWRDGTTLSPLQGGGVVAGLDDVTVTARQPAAKRQRDPVEANAATRVTRAMAKRSTSGGRDSQTSGDQSSDVAADWGGSQLSSFACDRVPMSLPLPPRGPTAPAQHGIAAAWEATEYAPGTFAQTLHGYGQAMPGADGTAPHGAALPLLVSPWADGPSAPGVLHPARHATAWAAPSLPAPRPEASFRPVQRGSLLDRVAASSASGARRATQAAPADRHATDDRWASMQREPLRGGEGRESLGAAPALASTLSGGLSLLADPVPLPTPAAAAASRSREADPRRSLAGAPQASWIPLPAPGLHDGVPSPLFGDGMQPHLPSFDGIRSMGDDASGPAGFLRHDTDSGPDT